jgi:tetratricopeptide (TPR) repeat protein
LVRSDNERLQEFCDAVFSFLNFSGRWDELLSLSSQAEAKAIAAHDSYNAGWRVTDAGYIYYLRRQPTEVLTHAQRAEDYWVKAGARERAFAIRLRGLGHQLARNYAAAVTAYQEVLTLLRTFGPESEDVVIGLNNLAEVEQRSGDYTTAERDYHEALRIAKRINYREGLAYLTGNLASLALDREDWPAAEQLAREALPSSDEVGRLELVAHDCWCLASALTKQGRKAEGLPYAQRAADIFAKLRSPELERAMAVLKECEEAKTQQIDSG